MRGQRKEVEQLQEEIAALEKRLAELEKQLIPMADAVHRYKRTPFDMLYMLGRRIKDYFIIRARGKAAKQSAAPAVKPAVKQEQAVPVAPAKPAPAVPEKTGVSTPLPGITVIIPTYKPNEYLEECVASVLNQDYDPEKVEIIISVNGKNADFAKWLTERYADEKQIRVIYTPVPGLSSGRNYAKRFIRTEFVTYLDDDDYFTKGYLRELASHVSPEISVVCGRLADWSVDGTVDDDTYINRALKQVGEGEHTDYLKLGSLFSPAWAKLYRTNQVTEVWGDFDESVVHTEDIIFWVENVYKPMKAVYTCAWDGKEALVRRLRENSMSRPDPQKQFAFFITDRVALIERFSKEVLVEDRPLNYKRFVLSKIDTHTRMMCDYFKNCSEQEKEAARQIINASDCLFLNKALFAEKKAIAFCHNFIPASDASAYVASKRLSQIGAYLGEPLAWKVICADMSKQRTSDPWWDMFYGRYQYVEKVMTTGATYFNEAAQNDWGKKAYEMMKDEVVPYIYSRSCWAGSHIAARLYKKAHPETVWIAEFSDPVYMGTDNCVRPVAKEYSGEQAFLNTFWKDLERFVFDEADRVIFTNENQKVYMLDHNAGENRSAIEEKSLVWHHPRVSGEYANIICSDYVMDEVFINIGYFGTFYANRSATPVLEFLKNPDVHIHMFTAVTEELTGQMKAISDRIHLHPMVSHLEFLNLAKRMDYLFLNDIKFTGPITPYLPSKLADYLAVGTTVLGLVYPNTPMCRMEEKNLVKLTSLDEFFIKNLKKSMEGVVQHYRSDIAALESFQDGFVESKSREVMIASADNLMNGIADCGFSTIVQPSLYDESGKICWDFTAEQTEGSRNTFYLYYRGLRPLYLLASAYDDTGNRDYLYRADQILTSFYEFFRNEDLQSEMLFNDHTQAERILNIIFFWDVAREAKYELNAAAAVALVSDAVEKLSGDTYYQRNHNHGIIVDKACMMGLYFLNRPNFVVELNRIVGRLKLQVDYAFAQDGIHKENSIDYHYIVLDLLLGCKNFLSHIDHPYLAELSARMNDAVEYVVYALKPNLKRPLLGDSKGEPIKFMKKLPAYIENFGNPHMEYVATQGKAGECPPDLFKRFPSGYLFMRQHFNPVKYQESTWLSLRAGFSTRVHKHSDDLSICLYSKGNDIFVDPGMYSYMHGDPRKDYMESLPAHTTVCIRDEAYKMGSGNGWAFKIQRAQRRSGYDYAMASSRGYNGVAIYRHLYYLRQMDVLVIRDECISDTSHTYAQYFHLGVNMVLPDELNARSVTMTMKDAPYAVTLQQLQGSGELRVLSGEKTQPMSLISAGFNDCIETNTLEYTKTAESATFISVVDIHRCEDAPCTSMVSEGDGVLIVEKLGRKIELPLEKSVPISADNVTTELLDKSKLVIRNEGADYSKHTVYLYNEANNDIVKLPYTTERSFAVDCSGIEKGTLLYFAANDTGEVLKQVLGQWTCEKGKGSFTQFQKPIGPWDCSMTLDKSAAPNYKVQIHSDPNMDTNISWWVYRNGALFDYTANKEREFSVTLTTPGEYVIMCSMRNKYFGEFLFQQFEKIVVE